jgi:hypothetical protein
MNVTQEHPEDLVTLVLKSTEFEANTTVAVLEDVGIKAFAFGAMRAALPLNDRLTGVPVQVRRMDLDRAQRALQQNVADSVDLDWDSVDVGDREDNLPLSTRKGMPALMKAGFATAVLAVIVMIVAAVVFVTELVL